MNSLLTTDADFQLLLRETVAAISSGGKVAILGHGEWTLGLVAGLREIGLLEHVVGVYCHFPVSLKDVKVDRFDNLGAAQCTHLVVASNEDKEVLLTDALPFVSGTPKVVLSGYGHLEFRDNDYDALLKSLLVPSLANGYPNTLIHIYQCLVSAHRLHLNGIVAEFGMFKGGTTMFMAKVIEQLGASWKVVGFDSFEGFPPRRSILDMYDHPDCVFTDIDSAHRLFADMNVEIVKGDIVQTCQRVRGEQIVLAFVDTDNYSPAKKVIDECRDLIVPGGAFVFDHFTGVDRFRYTLGERIAAQSLLSDTRFMNLHGTGVFLRMPTGALNS